MHHINRALLFAVAVVLIWPHEAMSQPAERSVRCILAVDEDGAEATQVAADRLAAAVVERLRAFGHDVEVGRCGVPLEVHVRAQGEQWRVRAWGGLHVDRWTTAPNADVLVLTTDVARVFDRVLVDTDARRVPSSRFDWSARPDTGESGTVWFPEVGILRSRLFGEIPPQIRFNPNPWPEPIGLRWGESQLAVTAGVAVRMHAHRPRSLQVGIMLDPRGSRGHEVQPAFPALRSLQVSVPVLWRLRMRHAGRGDDHFVIGIVPAFEIARYRFTPAVRWFSEGPYIEYPRAIFGVTMGLQHELRPSIRRDGSLRRREVSCLLTALRTTRPFGGLAGFEMSARWRFGR